MWCTLRSCGEYRSEIFKIAFCFLQWNLKVGKEEKRFYFSQIPPLFLASKSFIFIYLVICCCFCLAFPYGGSICPVLVVSMGFIGSPEDCIGRLYNNWNQLLFSLGTSPLAQRIKNLPTMLETQERPGFDPWGGKISWRKKWQPTPVFLPKKIPWTEEPGRLPSTGLQRVKH